MLFVRAFFSSLFLSCRQLSLIPVRESRSSSPFLSIKSKFGFPLCAFSSAPKRRKMYKYLPRLILFPSCPLLSFSFCSPSPSWASRLYSVRNRADLVSGYIHIDQCITETFSLVVHDLVVYMVYIYIFLLICLGY